MRKPNHIDQDAWDYAVSIADPIASGSLLYQSIVMSAASRIMAVRAEEREACAKEVDEVAESYEDYALFETAKEFQEVADTIRKRGEVKPAHPESVDGIPDVQLLERAVRNARSREHRKGSTHPRWVGVMDAFALGSTYSMQLCRRFDLNPDEQVKR